MTPYERMISASRGEAVPSDEPRPLSMVADVSLMACHRYLDMLNVPRFGALKPYDKTLVSRLIWLYHNCEVRPFEQVNNNENK